MSYLKYAFFLFALPFLLLSCTSVERNEVIGIYREVDNGNRFGLERDGSCHTSAEVPFDVHLRCDWEVEGDMIKIIFWDEHTGEATPEEKLSVMWADYNPTSQMLHIRSEDLHYRKIE